MSTSKKTTIRIVENLAEQFVLLDNERQRIEREAREIRKRLDELKENMQRLIGYAEMYDIPYVARVSHYYILQIRKHRDVDAYSYDFIEFKVVTQ